MEASTDRVCYIVTFEVKSEESRQRVRARLKTYAGYCPIHMCCLAILTTKSASDVRNYIGEVLRPGERVFVIRSGTAAAWRGTYGPKNSQWLKKNL